MLPVLLLLAMGCANADNSDRKHLDKSVSDICELTHFSQEFRQGNYKKLEKKLSNFCDDEKELKCIVKEILDFSRQLADDDIEYLSAMDMDFNLVCNQYSIKEADKVDLCPEGKEKSALLFVIHNHPSYIPLQSHGDVMSFARYNVKYNIVYTQKNGIFILKNDGADSYDIKMGWEDTFQKMRNHYIENNFGAYEKEYLNFCRGIITHREFAVNLNSNVVEHMENNIDISIVPDTENYKYYKT